MEDTKERQLEQRLKEFALVCGTLFNGLPKTQQNLIYQKQLIRSSSSIGANYAEATCAMTRKDFTYDINKCRKEAKESHYWLDLILHTNKTCGVKIQPLLSESHELLKIFQKSFNTLQKNKQA